MSSYNRKGKIIRREPRQRQWAESIKASNITRMEQRNHNEYGGVHQVEQLCWISHRVQLGQRSHCSLLRALKAYSHCGFCLQELFFSGMVSSGGFRLPEEDSPDQQVFDGNGRNLIYHLHRDTPGFLLRDHLSQIDEAVPFSLGASSSAFCYVPYGQAGGYGGRCAPR